MSKIWNLIFKVNMSQKWANPGDFDKLMVSESPPWVMVGYQNPLVSARGPCAHLLRKFNVRSKSPVPILPNKAMSEPCGVKMSFIRIPRVAHHRAMSH